MKKFIATGAATVIALSLAIPAFAEDAMSSSTTTGTTSSAMHSEGEKMMKQDKMMKKTPVTVDVTCMQNAVEKRDTAIMAGVDAYSAAVKTALMTRKDALKAAWALTDKTQRNAALKTAWTAFEGTWKKASAAMKTARNGAWTAFKTDSKACKQTGAEATGEMTDMKL